MKILALDLGDRWVGSAISDPLGITCKPYQTVEIAGLADFLTQTIAQQRVATIVVGYPKTFSGGQSLQTEKVLKVKESLQAHFSALEDVLPINWVLWDERLSSKRAHEIQQKASSVEAKLKSHSIAAAFILQSYLDNLAFGRESS